MQVQLHTCWICGTTQEDLYRFHALGPLSPTLLCEYPKVGSNILDMSVQVLWTCTDIHEVSTENVLGVSTA